MVGLALGGWEDGGKRLLFPVRPSVDDDYMIS
jgi:hypothetical protein